MAAKKRRRSKATRRREAKQRISFATAVVAAVLFVLWRSPWLLISIPCATALAGLGWVLWKAHLWEQTGDRAWREQNRRMELERSMATIDAMSWQDFEHYVAELCRRDGCINVTVTGGSGDLGADVVGTLADGRHLVAQVKHYAPHRYVPSGDMQKYRRHRETRAQSGCGAVRRHLPVRESRPRTRCAARHHRHQPRSVRRLEQRRTPGIPAPTQRGRRRAAPEAEHHPQAGGGHRIELPGWRCIPDYPTTRAPHSCVNAPTGSGGSGRGTRTWPHGSSPGRASPSALGPAPCPDRHAVGSRSGRRSDSPAAARCSCPSQRPA